MATEPQIGWGSEFHLHDGATPGALVMLGQVTNVTPPNEQAEDVEVTHYKSPGKRREYIGGLIESGEGTIEMNYLPGSPTDLLIRAALTAGTPRAYKIVLPDGAGTHEIDGFCIVKGYERAIPIDNRMTATVTVRFTGASTEEAGA